MLSLKYRLVIYFCFSFFCLFFWLCWETDRNLVRRAIYPFKGQLVAWSTECSENYPYWMKDLIESLAFRNDSPANQLVFLNHKNLLFSCVNGWEGFPFLSKKIDELTIMRLASLSKIVSFVGLMNIPEEDRPRWLDVPITNYIDIKGLDYDIRIDSIKIHHLLNHSSGFDRLKSEDPTTQMRKRSWCPNNIKQLETLKLDYMPGTHFSYHNLGYCLASVAYEKKFKKSLSETLKNELNITDYGLEWIDLRDSPVEYNFMHSHFYGPDFIKHIDWQAARAPMGLTGNALGLAKFIKDHRDALELAKSLRDDSIPCDASKSFSCFDGFLNRIEINGKTLWQQAGYFYGMSALFVMDENDNFIVWLGAGESRPLSAARQSIYEALLQLH